MQHQVNVHMELLTRVAILGSSSFSLAQYHLRKVSMFLTWPAELQSAVLEPRAMEENLQSKQADYINIILTVWLVQ